MRRVVVDATGVVEGLVGTMVAMPRTVDVLRLRLTREPKSRMDVATQAATIGA